MDHSKLAKSSAPFDQKQEYIIRNTESKSKKKKKKQSISRRNDTIPSTSTQKIFGTNQSQIGGDDASRLIGSIVEKGISDNPLNKPLATATPPKPTVLPFPVARHRSHGPHWGPVSSKNGGRADNVADEEDNDPTDFDPISAFANPVERKQRKGLDLSRWKELIANNSSLGIDKLEENRLDLKKTGRLEKDGQVVDDKALMEVDIEPNLTSAMPGSITGEAMSCDIGSGALTSVADMETDNLHQLEVQQNSDLYEGKVGSTERMSSTGVTKARLEKTEKMDPILTDMLKKPEQKTSTMVSTASFNGLGNEQGSMSLESEIDVENRARLQSMSPEEIAQAHAEIMEKMDPALLNLLKKRGQEKIKKRNLSRSGEAVNDQVASTPSENQSIKEPDVSTHLGSDSCDRMASTSIDTKGEQVNGVVQNLCPASGSLWNAWSERVEAVRGLRFSMEGTVIADETETGNITMSNRHSPDNIAERDFLRTEGDPGAAGYTIKEAVQLTRSVIPGQRALALHLLQSVLDKAIHNIQQNQVGCATKIANHRDKSVDWEAIWAFALGPEPELVLALRMCLDDDHRSVVLACAKVMQCVLSCDLNENFFEISEKIATCKVDMFTAPVFRSKSEIDVGYLHGGFWKYNTKPSNILTFAEDVVDDEIEQKQTIQDDIVVAGQDFAAGLVRMGILPRMLYLLEADPIAALEESIISILVAIAKHSPTCANAIMKCQRLGQTVVHRFTCEDSIEVHISRIKSVRLLTALAQSDKKNCLELIKNGTFDAVTRDLYRYTSSLEHWVKLGKENCKLSSALMVEQLHFWKVCIHYGCCISYFPDIFPALCLWLNPPTFTKLQENNVLVEFTAISREAYLVLGALAGKLPNFYSQKNQSCQISDFAGDGLETWSWNYVPPLIDLALKWIASKSDPYVSKLFEWQKANRSDLVLQGNSLLWVYSAVMHMLSTLLERVIPEASITLEGTGRHVPWLPEFVPKLGLEIIKNGFVSCLGASGTEHGKYPAGGGSFIEILCLLRRQSKYETSLASVCCLHGLLRVIVFIDELIRLAKREMCAPLSQGDNFSVEGKVLEDGVIKRSLVELRSVLHVFMKLVTSEWHSMQSVEIFGRGGPAPGAGVGWGASGGGFWSMTILLAQTDAGLLIHMLDIFQIVSSSELPTDEEMVFAIHRINSVLGICLISGPRHRDTVEKAIDILLQVPVLKCLDLCIRHCLQSNKRMNIFGWAYKEEDYLHFSKILASHFKSRWLSVKKKSKAMVDSHSFGNRTSKGKVPLDTIHEDLTISNMTSQDRYSTSLTAEWAYQRLPLPLHWFLSPISTISDTKHSGHQSSSNVPSLTEELDNILEVAKGGLFFLLGVEALSAILSTDAPSPVCCVPLVWKLHSLSVILLVGMGVLEDDKSRDFYEALQILYGQLLDETRSTKNAARAWEENINLLAENGEKSAMVFLRFQSDIHEGYSTFLETLVEQFAAISYGDLTFGRQVAVYLHRCCEAPVRLAAWNALANAHVLEILPPLEKCLAEAEGYLEPIEDNEGILEAYMKSWVSGAVDRAASRGSMAFTLVLHHLSSFIFLCHANGQIQLRNKLAKSLLRDYSRKQKHEGMMLDLVQHYKPTKSPQPEQEGSPLQASDIEKRFEVLVEACDRDSSLLTAVEKLKSASVRKYL